MQLYRPDPAAMLRWDGGKSRGAARKSSLPAGDIRHPCQRIACLHRRCSSPAITAGARYSLLPGRPISRPASSHSDPRTISWVHASPRPASALPLPLPFSLPLCPSSSPLLVSRSCCVPQIEISLRSTSHTTVLS